MKTASTMDNKESLRRLRIGDVVTFEEIYSLYAKGLLVKLKRLIKIDESVEEIHQDVFIRLWNSRTRLSIDTNIEAYLYTIARNLVIDFYRKAARDKELERALFVQIKLSYNHIEDLLNVKEAEGILKHIIGKLPPRRRSIFVVIKIEGKSYEEAAQTFAVSLSTVKDHMAKAMDFLKSELRRDFSDFLFLVALFHYL